MSGANQTATPFTTTTPDGATLSGYRQGTGAPVVLISGLGGTASFWQPVVSRLAGRTCITFDQRGIGRSSRGTAQVSIGRLAEDVLWLLDALEIESATLIGHSTGGCIATECSLLAPDRVSALILSGTWAGPNEYMTRLFYARLRLLQVDPALYQGLNPYLSFPAEWLVQHPRLIPQYEPSNWDKQRVAVVEERIKALLAFNRRDALSTLAQPCLVLGARDDLVVPNFLQQEIVERVPGAEHEFLTDGGHFYPLSRTDAFVNRVTNWNGWER